MQRVDDLKQVFQVEKDYGDFLDAVLKAERKVQECASNNCVKQATL